MGVCDAARDAWRWGTDRSSGPTRSCWPRDPGPGAIAVTTAKHSRPAGEPTRRARPVGSDRLPSRQPAGSGYRNVADAVVSSEGASGTKAITRGMHGFRAMESRAEPGGSSGSGAPGSRRQMDTVSGSGCNSSMDTSFLDCTHGIVASNDRARSCRGARRPLQVLAFGPVCWSSSELGISVLRAERRPCAGHALGGVLLSGR